MNRTRFLWVMILSLILGFAGEPLCAPLEFVGRDSRRLNNVVIHVPGDDD